MNISFYFKYIDLYFDIIIFRFQLYKNINFFRFKYLKRILKNIQVRMIDYNNYKRGDKTDKFYLI